MGKYRNGKRWPFYEYDKKVKGGAAPSKRSSRKKPQKKKSLACLGQVLTQTESRDGGWGNHRPRWFRAGAHSKAQRVSKRILRFLWQRSGVFKERPRRRSCGRTGDYDRTGTVLEVNHWDPALIRRNWRNVSVRSIFRIELLSKRIASQYSTTLLSLSKFPYFLTAAYEILSHP